MVQEWFSLGNKIYHTVYDVTPGVLHLERSRLHAYAFFNLLTYRKRVEQHKV